LSSASSPYPTIKAGCFTGGYSAAVERTRGRQYYTDILNQIEVTCAALNIQLEEQLINPVVTSVPTNEGFDLVLRREEDVATYSAGGFTGTYAEATERANGRKGYIVVLDYLKTIADAHGLLEEAKVELAEGVHRWDTAEGVVYVKLVSSREGRPMLRAVQPDGTEVESGCIFTFDSRHIYRNMGINSTVQIPRDGSRVNMETTL